MFKTNKLLLLTAIFVISCFLFASCFLDIKVKEENSGSTSAAGSDDVVEEITLIVPSFDGLESGDSGRGLTDMFNDDTFFACFNPAEDPYAVYKNLYLSYGVMTTTPITPSLRSISNVRLTTSAINSLKTTLSFSSYGFHVEVEDIGLDILSHEILIKYNIVENNSVVGIVDYVYNWQNKSFSYRESVMLTLFGESVPEEAYTFGVMILEMHDIKLDTDLFGIPTGSYSTGSFDDGVLEQNAWVDFINYSGTISNNSNLCHPFKLVRNYLTVSSRDGRLFSMSQPNSSESILLKIEEMNPNNPVYKAMVDSGFVILRDQDYLDSYDWSHYESDDFYDYSKLNPRAIGMDFLKDLADLAYTNGSILRSTELTDLSEPLILIEGSDENAEEHMFTAYDVNTKTGASLQLLGTKWLFTLFNDTNYEYCNFESFDSSIYRSYDSDATYRVIVDGLIEDHLKACGINDSNYIKNYQLSQKYYELFGNGSFITDVTNENPDLFKAKLDDLVRDKKERYLIAEYKNMVFLSSNIELSGGSYSGDWIRNSSYGPFTRCQVTIHLLVENGSIAEMVFTSDTENVTDQVLYLSFPDAITSINDDLFNSLTSLECIEVSSSFDTSNLPEGLEIIIR